MKSVLALVACAGLACAGLAGCNVFGAMPDSSGNGSFDRATPVPASATEVAAFTKLASQGADTVKVVSGTRFSIMATGPAETLAALRYRIEGGEIAIGRKRGSYSLAPATVTVTAPFLTDVSLAGSGDAAVPLLKGDSANIGLAGSGDLTVDRIEALSLNADIAGSGSVTAHGRTRSVDVSIAGSGSFVAPGLQADQAEVNIAGSGDASFASDGQVEANILGSGNITVAGKPKCNVSKLGAGTLRCG